MRFAMLVLALSVSVLAGSAGAQDQPVVQVQTATVQRAPIAPRIAAYGTVTLAPEVQTDLSLPYAAQITRLRASAGQAVRRGDELFAAEADPGALLAVQQAQSAVTLARGDLQRTRALYAQRLATQSQVAGAETALADALQAAAAQSALGAAAGERVVRAPYDGVVVRVAAAQGDRVAAGTAVLQLGRTGATTPARVTLGIDPALRRSVAVGAAVALTSLATPAGVAEAPLAGRVSRVQAAINAQTRMVDVQVDVAARDAARLIPGEPVRGVIALPGTEHWVVPRLAVLRDTRGAYVYQLDQGRARRVAVQVRVDDGDRLGVDGPLQGALPLVVQGNYELAEGMPAREAGK